jgi:hypothetical protein
LLLFVSNEIVADRSIPTQERIAVLSMKARAWSLLGLLVVLPHRAVIAQSAPPPTPSPAPSPSRAYETRAQLENQARAAEARRRNSEAFLLRSRLQKGDFQEGDRIVIVLENSPRVDTMLVRSGKVLQLVGMSDLSLEGVLRSELTDTLRHHLSKYLVNPGVRATPLLPIAVLGSVGNPGYYYTAADVVLRDVIMRAGGPREGDLNRVVIRRGGETVWNAAATRVALADGLSLDRLHLRAGDEIFIPARKQRISMTTVLATVSATTTFVLLLTRGRSR